MKTSLGQFLVSYPFFFFFFGLAGLACVTSRQNCKWEWKMAATPLSHKPRPSIGRGQQDGGVQVGGGFLWTRSFTYRKRERKLRIKLFDRYFSSFSQRA